MVRTDRALVEGSVECGGSSKQKNEKQNELGAKFTDNIGTKLIKKIRARS